MSLDADHISSILGVQPTKIWRRKPNLVVHGNDNIPEMAWEYSIQNSKYETENTLDRAINDILDVFDGKAAALACLLKESNFSASIVCTYRTDNLVPGVYISHETLKRVILYECDIGWSVQVDPPDPA